MKTDTIVCSDALPFLSMLPDNVVNCIVTSPPYYGLRDYGVDGQMGLESTPQEYIAKMVALFREVRRVLRDDGTVWVNIGDSYGSGEVGRHDQKEGHYIAGHGAVKGFGEPRQYHRISVQPKSLMLIPFRLAIALQDDGWIVRSDIIWAKPNPMPESVTDRPTKAHEYVFLLSKCPDYWYDQEAIREAAVDGDPTSPRGSIGVISNSLNSGARDKQSQLGKRQYTGFNQRWDNRTEPLITRNARSVWTISTEPTPFAHFATFPQALVEKCILAGCPRGSIVCDPFMGSGTTALVARRLGRHYIGCDLNPDYVALANKRLLHTGKELKAVLAGQPFTIPMFAEDK